MYSYGKRAMVMCIPMSLTLGFALSSALPVAAASLSSHTSPPSASTSDCYVTAVHLHGDQPSSQACVVKTKQAADALKAKAIARSGVNPNATVEGICGFFPDITYYEDINYSGRELCVDGYGRLDLTTIWIIWPVANWSNRISSVAPLDVTTNLYSDPSCNSSPSPTYDWPDWQSNLVNDGWNDRAQCVRIY